MSCIAFPAHRCAALRGLMVCILVAGSVPVLASETVPGPPSTAPQDDASPLEELTPAPAETTPAPSSARGDEDVGWPSRASGAAAEGGVGALVALGANVAVPVVLFAALMVPVFLLARMTLQQNNNGWEDIIAVLVVVLGGIVAGAVALASAPLGAALAFVVGVSVAAAVRALARLATAGLRPPDAADVLVPALAVAAALPTLLLAGALMTAAAALIPITFTITNAISIAELPPWVFPGLLVAGAGMAAGALVLDLLLGLTVRTALYVGLRVGTSTAAERLLSSTQPESTTERATRGPAWATDG
jgi:hypothetical protein